MISLSAETQRMIEERMKKGGYQSADDAVRAALATLDQQEDSGDFAAGELDEGDSRSFGLWNLGFELVNPNDQGWESSWSSDGIRGGNRGARARPDGRAWQPL